MLRSEVPGMSHHFINRNEKKSSEREMKRKKACWKIAMVEHIEGIERNVLK